MNKRLVMRYSMAAVLGLAGLATAAPRGWSTDYAGTVQSAQANGKTVLVAIVDTANAYGSRAFMRNVLEDEGWAAWRAANADSLSLVWWDRAEISAKRWASVAFTFAPEPGEAATLSLPLIAVLSPDGRADRLDSDDEDLAAFDDFTARIDVTLDAWKDLPSGPLVWPTVTSGAGTLRAWSLDYQGSRDAGFAKKVPVLVAIMDSKKSPTATETWVRGVLMSEEWKDWLAENNLLLVWWDRDKISRSKWDDVAFRFAEDGKALSLPQMALFNPDGAKVDQFLAVNGDGGNYARADDFIERLDGHMSEWDGVQTGPGTIGFTSSSVTTNAGAASVAVTVRRSGGASEGAQVFQLRTVSPTNANAADAGIDYTPVNTNLAWAAGESGNKVVTIPLLGDGLDWAATVTQRVFQVALTKTGEATAKIGITNLTVTITNKRSVVPSGPGTIGFTSNAATAHAGAASVAVTVRRIGGSEGAQSFWLKTVSPSNAVAGTDYTAVATILTWAAGESGDKRVMIPLLGDGLDWGTTVTQRVFQVSLTKTNNATASAGTTNLTVTLNSCFSVTGGWSYNTASNLWSVIALTNPPATLTWTAPQAGLLTFSEGKLSGFGQLSVVAAGVPLAVTNVAVAAVAVAEGANVMWTATNCMAAVVLHAWSPLAAATLVSPADGASFTMMNLPSLAWTAPTNATANLSYGKSASALSTMRTNALSGVGTSALGLTNGTCYWRVDTVVSGAFGTVAQTKGTVWSFSVNDGTVPPGLKALKDVAPGVFQGMLLDEDGIVRGALVLTVSASGALSAKVEAGGSRSRTLRGEWRSGPRSARKARFGNGTDAALEVTMAGDGAEGRTDGGWAVLASRVLGPKDVALFAGYYTAVLHTAANTEDGTGGKGYLTFTVAARTGSVKYSGRLADGTSVSGAAKLMPGGEQSGAVRFPLYKGLYARCGAVSGLVTLSPDGRVALDRGTWVCPAAAGYGFSAEVIGVGTVYAENTALSGFDGAVLSVADVPVATVSVAGNQPAAAGNGVTLHVAAKTGLFFGSLMDEQGIRWPFKGVLTPPLAYGAGFWLWPDNGAAGERTEQTSPVEIKGRATP